MLVRARAPTVARMTMTRGHRRETPESGTRDAPPAPARESTGVHVFRPEAILALQRNAGNAAVTSMLARLIAPRAPAQLVRHNKGEPAVSRRGRAGTASGSALDAWQDALLSPDAVEMRPLRGSKRRMPRAQMQLQRTPGDPAGAAPLVHVPAGATPLWEWIAGGATVFSY